MCATRTRPACGPPLRCRARACGYLRGAPRPGLQPLPPPGPRHRTGTAAIRAGRRRHQDLAAAPAQPFRPRAPAFGHRLSCNGRWARMARSRRRSSRRRSTPTPARCSHATPGVLNSANASAFMDLRGTANVVYRRPRGIPRSPRHARTRLPHCAAASRCPVASARVWIPAARCRHGSNSAPMAKTEIVLLLGDADRPRRRTRIDPAISRGRRR